jgi:hypothetical protein
LSILRASGRECLIKCGHLIYIVLIQIRVSGDKMENEQAVFQNAEIVAELCVRN